MEIWKLKPDIRYPSYGFNTVNIMWALTLHTTKKNKLAALSYGFTPQQYESLKCWLVRLNILNQFGGLSKFGDDILKNDPYFYLPETLMLLHWKLFTNDAMIVFRWYFGNYSQKNSLKTFGALFQDLKRWTKNNDYNIADSTLTSQLKLLLKLYCYGDITDRKEQFNSPFSPLKLLTAKHSDILGDIGYRANGLNMGIDIEGIAKVFSQLIPIWQKQFIKSDWVDLEDFLLHSYSPCRAFNFSENQAVLLLDMLTEKRVLCWHTNHPDNEKRNKIELLT